MWIKHKREETLTVLKKVKKDGIIMDHIFKSDEQPISTHGLPLGLGMALSQNASAMQRFAEMSYDERQYVIDAAHSISSKKEMKAYVDTIGTGKAKKGR